ncbi:unnamed protein product [Amoebophrya sp. A120]|nr:unnamed protein product [Amoebophrya sp. A120]|eukprot:GSA120T00023362001.1
MSSTSSSTPSSSKPGNKAESTSAGLARMQQRQMLRQRKAVGLPPLEAQNVHSRVQHLFKEKEPPQLSLGERGCLGIIILLAVVPMVWTPPFMVDLARMLDQAVAR